MDSLENDPPVNPTVDPQIIKIVNTGMKIVGTRTLGFVALLGAIGIWGTAVAFPDSLKLWAGLGYSLTVLVPTIMLYMKRG